VGATLAPYVERQWGAAFETLIALKQALDPANVMNPGKLGLPVAPAAAAH
jgi:alkyldihydroxyacetonephosphate synthase